MDTVLHVSKRVHDALAMCSANLDVSNDVVVGAAIRHYWHAHDVAGRAALAQVYIRNGPNGSDGGRLYPMPILPKTLALAGKSEQTVKGIRAASRRQQVHAALWVFAYLPHDEQLTIVREFAVMEKYHGEAVPFLDEAERSCFPFGWLFLWIALAAACFFVGVALHG